MENIIYKNISTDSNICISPLQEINENFNVNNYNENKFYEIYKKIFPSHSFSKNEFINLEKVKTLIIKKDLTDSTQNTLENESVNCINETTKKHFNSIFKINYPISFKNNSSNFTEVKNNIKTIKKSSQIKLAEELEIFNESKKLDEILSKIDLFIEINSSHKIKEIYSSTSSIINDSNNEQFTLNNDYCELKKKLKSLKFKYNSNRISNSDNNNDNISVLLEINQILYKLIQIGKNRISIIKHKLFSVDDASKK